MHEGECVARKKPISYIIISHFIAWINKWNKGE